MNPIAANCLQDETIQYFTVSIYFLKTNGKTYNFKGIEAIGKKRNN